MPRDRKQGAFVERAERIEAALTTETWLPLGLRSLIASELPQIKRDLKCGRCAKAQQNVHRLAATSFRYGPSLLDSTAVAQLRVLDLELSSGRENRFSKKGDLMGGLRRTY